MAFLETKNRFLYYAGLYGLNISSLSYHGVDAFNTIENSFVISQLSLNICPKNYIIFHNVAPRKDDLSARSNNAGEPLCFVKTKNAIVIGVFSGYSLSLLKNEAEVYILNCPVVGSQFRSRDIFPEYTIRVVRHYLEHQNVDPFIANKQEIFPEMAENTILYIDGYGNLKTNINIDKIEAQDGLKIKINNIEKIIRVNKGGVFAAKDGDLILSIGSSGWESKSGKRKIFTEIFLRGGSACDYFGGISIGDKVFFV